MLHERARVRPHRDDGPNVSARIALCVARFYAELADRLVAGARGALARPGDRAGRGLRGPGRLRAAAGRQLRCAESGRYAGVVCLGAVIRGETDHYDYVCGEAARGIQDVQLRTGVPCGFGVLTVDTMEQALARTGGGKRDTGATPPRRCWPLAVIASAGLRPGSLALVVALARALAGRTMRPPLQPAAAAGAVRASSDSCRCVAVGDPSARGTGSPRSAARAREAAADLVAGVAA